MGGVLGFGRYGSGLEAFDWALSLDIPTHKALYGLTRIPVM